MTSKPPFGGEAVRLNQLCSKGKSNLRQKDIENDGPFNVYGASGIVGRMDTYQNERPYVAIVKDGAGVGRAMLCEGKTSVLGTMQALLPNEGTNLSYLLHLVRSLKLGENYSGSTIPHIYFKDYGRQEVPALSAGQQSAIAERLDLAEQLVALIDDETAKLDSLVKSRFVEMFDGAPWQVVRASDVMTSFRNGVSPSKDGDIHERVLTLSAITQGYFDETAWKDGTFKELPASDKRVSDSDFYICRGNGNKQLVGAGEFADANHPELVFPDTMIAGTINKNLVRKPFLTQVWKHPSVRRQIEAKARTTNGTLKINQKIVSEIRFPLPPLDVQDEFASFIERVDKLRVEAQAQKEKLQTLYDSLAQDYFAI